MDCASSSVMALCACAASERTGQRDKPSINPIVLLLMVPSRYSRRFQRGTDPTTVSRRAHWRLVWIEVGKGDNALIITIAPRRRDCVFSRTIKYLHPSTLIQYDIFNHEIATDIGRAVRRRNRAKLGASFLRPSSIIGPIATQLGAFG